MFVYLLVCFSVYIVKCHFPKSEVSYHFVKKNLNLSPGMFLTSEYMNKIEYISKYFLDEYNQYRYINIFICPHFIMNDMFIGLWKRYEPGYHPFEQI